MAIERRKFDSIMTPKNLGQDHGRDRIVVPDHDIPDEPEEHAGDRIEDIVVDGVRADHAGDEDQGDQETAVNVDDLGEEPGEHESQDHENDIRRDHPGEDLMDEIQVILEQERTGLEIVNGEGAHQDRGGGVARQSQREHGQDVPTGAGVLRALGGSHPLQDAGPEELRMLGGSLGLAVADEAGGLGPDGRASHRRSGR